MANIEIGGRLHSTATGNVVTGANEVLDDTKNKKQSVINAEVDAAIGDDNTEGTIKGRIKAVEGDIETLNGDSSISGSVAKAVADAKTELIGGATSGGNTLKKVEDRTATLETAVGSNGSVDQRIAAAKSEVIGDAASDYNTLGKLEDKIQAEASARESAVSTEAQARQDAITAETNRATTRENQIYDLVHTPEQHYVTVATYAELANIASPSDDTIYRVSSYNGNTSQVDNTVYSEYGYDGTNFVFLCVKSQIDEVYDISAHHSNNTYVDLAAALDGGNNIPQELRRGGMSVKFVQSSDNKYVQARCMAQSFTTDVTQWQGVDDTPIAGSKNLVKSGGIFGFKSVINLSKVLNAYVGASLSNGQYGYNIDTNNIVYKDDNGGLCSYSLKDGVLYLYKNFVFEKGIDPQTSESSLVLRVSNGAIPVLGISGVPGSPSEGVYYVPTVKRLAFVSDTSEQSTSRGVIRASAIEGTEMLFNGNKFVMHDDNVFPAAKNAIINVNTRLINFKAHRKLVIPQNAVVIYGGDNNRYNVPADVELEIPTVTTSFIVKYNISTNVFSLQAASVKVGLEEYVICNFTYGQKLISCSLPSNIFGINSDSVSYGQLLSLIANRHKYPISWMDGNICTQTADIGETATFGLVTISTWHTRKLKVKQGDVLYVRAVGGTLPKALTITDDDGVVLFTINGIASYIYIEHDGFVVVNSADVTSDRELTLYSEDADRDITNRIHLSKILNGYTSQFLSNNEFGYAISSNNVVLKDVNGTVSTSSPANLGNVEFIFDGCIFVAGNSGLILKNQQPPIPIISTIGAPSNPTPGFYFVPSANKISFVSEKNSVSTSIGIIRTDAEGMLLTNGDGLVYEVKNGELVIVSNIPPMVHFTIDDKLNDFEGEAAILPFNGKTLFTEIYAKMDALVALYPDFIEKVDVMTFLATEMAALGVNDYPAYANGILSETTVHASDVYGEDFPAGHADYDITYVPTPAYKTYMYIFKNNRDVWGNRQVNIHKKVLLIGGTHGYEMASQVNCYNFAKQLCENLASDRNYFALRNACDFYIIPCLNGYSLYHSPYNSQETPYHPRCNANGVNINRNYDCENGFAESGSGTYDYTGPFAFSEFESKIVKCLTEKINPFVCIDHHSYTKSANPIVTKTQVFFGSLPNAYVGRTAYQVAVDFSCAMQKNFPAYFGNSGNILLDNGVNLRVIDAKSDQETSSWWSQMKKIRWSITCEVSHDIMYDHGTPVSGYTTWTATDEIFQINEYYLRITLLRMLEEVFSGKYDK